jgi:hypothetical protein
VYDVLSTLPDTTTFVRLIRVARNDPTVASLTDPNFVGTVFVPTDNVRAAALVPRPLVSHLSIATDQVLMDPAACTNLLACLHLCLCATQAFSKVSCPSAAACPGGTVFQANAHTCLMLPHLLPGRAPHQAQPGAGDLCEWMGSWKSCVWSSCCHSPAPANRHHGGIDAEVLLGAHRMTC